jgi:hypothetical protein
MNAISDAPHCSTLPELTEFQKSILWAVEKSRNQMANTWEIAQDAFPEKWAKRSGRGALIGHIDRAAMKMDDLLVRLDPKTRFDAATFCVRRDA